MNLKKQYQRLFEGRRGHAKANNLIMEDSLLNEAPMVQAFPKMKTTAQQRAAGVAPRSYDGKLTHPEPFDIEYWSDEINTILTSIDDYHQELGTTIEMKSQETGDYQYETAEKQVSRYIRSAQKGLEDLQKYLERQKGNL